MGDLFVGLISGTSMDGADAAIAQFDDDGGLSTLACDTFPYPADLRARLLDAIAPGARLTLHEIGCLDIEVGRHFAHAAQSLLAQARLAPGAIAAIGSHGQTLRHHPYPPAPYTMQIGCGATIAALTGVTTVADFRRIDVACGGQGAPLVPPFHAACLASPDADRVVVNIGGIANISLLRAGAKTASLGFDSGPGNCLMDEWTTRHRGAAFDADGAWAATGTVREDLLAVLLADPYFAEPVPKSTGRELFNSAFLARALARLSTPPDAADVQATLCQLTVETIARDIESCTAGSMSTVYVCGGGASNGELMKRLSARLAPRGVASTGTLGVDASFVEALAFAWYAKRRLDNLPTLLTTASPQRELVLGVVHLSCTQSGLL